MTVDVVGGREAWDLRSPHWNWKLGPNLAAVVSVDGKPVSCARIFTMMSARLTGLHWKACGIGGVYTLPKYRRRGYAEAAVREAAWCGREVGCTLALLYSRGEAALYRKIGFRKIKEMGADGDLYAAPLIEGIDVSVGEWKIDPEGKF